MDTVEKELCILEIIFQSPQEVIPLVYYYLEDIHKKYKKSISHSNYTYTIEYLLNNSDNLGQSNKTLIYLVVFFLLIGCDTLFRESIMPEMNNKIDYDFHKNKNIAQEITQEEQSIIGIHRGFFLLCNQTCRVLLPYDYTRDNINTTLKNFVKMQFDNWHIAHLKIYTQNIPLYHILHDTDPQL